MLESGKHYIYLLSDPRWDIPFYVGASNDPIRRLGQHLCTKTDNKRMTMYISEIKRVLMVPKISILEVTDKNSRTARELFWITHYNELYPNSMCNMSGIDDELKKQRKLDRLNIRTEE